MTEDGLPNLNSGESTFRAGTYQIPNTAQILQIEAI